MIISYEITQTSKYYSKEGLKLGKDEHRTPKGKKQLSQTPKTEITDNTYVELSEDLADHHNKEAQRRKQAADQRMNKK